MPGREFIAPAPANDVGLALMQRTLALFMAWPFLGSRRMTLMLRTEGYAVNRKRVQRLMRLQRRASMVEVSVIGVDLV